MTDSFVVDRSLIFLLLSDGRLSVQMLGAYNRPQVVTDKYSTKQLLEAS